MWVDYPYKKYHFHLTISMVVTAIHLCTGAEATTNIHERLQLSSTDVD